MMEEQVRWRREEVERIREVRGRVEGILEGLGGGVDDGGVELGGARREGLGDNRENEERMVWEELEKQLGGGGSEKTSLSVGDSGIS